MARILVIEDDPNLHKIVAYHLRRADYEVLSAYRGREGLALARGKAPDLILLDLMLPDVGGTEICTLIKREHATAAIPVLILTARGDESDRVLGLEIGAEDYVVKPFSVRELMLRITALLRRCRPTSAPANTMVELGALRIDRDGHKVWVNKRLVALTAIEYKLLVALYDRRNKVSSRATLLDEVWGAESDVTERAVDTHVQRLREKLGTVARHVETVRGFGYCFTTQE